MNGVYVNPAVPLNPATTATPEQGPGHSDSAAPVASAFPEAHQRVSFWTLALGSIGVVYGDIGTSPLYALKESVAAASAGGEITRDMSSRPNT
jgi:hypothetical protein